jgi:hypothetical protein
MLAVAKDLSSDEVMCFLHRLLGAGVEVSFWDLPALGERPAASC